VSDIERQKVKRMLMMALDYIEEQEAEQEAEAVKAEMYRPSPPSPVARRSGWELLGETTVRSELLGDPSEPVRPLETRVVEDGIYSVPQQLDDFKVQAQAAVAEMTPSLSWACKWCGHSERYHERENASCGMYRCQCDQYERVQG